MYLQRAKFGSILIGTLMRDMQTLSEHHRDKGWKLEQPFCSGLFQKKIPGRGRRQAIYFSMGGWCGKFSNYKKKTKKLFVAFPWVETSTGPGGFMICVFII